MQAIHVIGITFLFLMALPKTVVKTLNFMQVESDLNASSVNSSGVVGIAVAAFSSAGI
jgi:hypothetical protein